MALVRLETSAEIFALVFSEPVGLFWAEIESAERNESKIMPTYKDGKKKKNIKATKTVKTPSRMKIQRQPEYPRMPSTEFGC